MDYAERGWPVFPCGPHEKRPLGRLVRHGLRNATTDIGLVESWWREEPTANVATTAGGGFDVLDLDDLKVIGDLPGLPRGPTVRTGRGLHIYMQATGGGSRKLQPGVDLKGRGGYVLLPPSRHPSGATYRWIVGADEADLAPPPAWLVDILRPFSALSAPGGRAGQPPFGASFAFCASDHYAQAALDGEIAKVLLAEVGERNVVLNRAAFRLGQLAHRLEEREVVDGLLQAATMAGLARREALATIQSGWGAGRQRPRCSA